MPASIAYAHHRSVIRIVGDMAVEVADRIYRLGAALVNWWLVEDGGRLTVIDAGNPRQYEQLPKALAALGRSLRDVEAVVLTHAHGDHLGSSARIKATTGAGVHVHTNDVALAKGDTKREYERHVARDLGHAFARKSMLFFMRGGAAKAPSGHELVEFSHGDTIDVPGQPRVIHTPGHTDGSACIELANRKALVTGDALVTLSIVTGDRGPRVMPGSFNKNSVEALESLNELKGAAADVILPGHGEPWHGNVDAAVAVAQQTGAS